VIAFITKRLILLPITLFFLCTITFFIVRLTPGGPFSSEKNMDPQTAKALAQKFHLDAPLYAQYGIFIGDLLHGDLGPSYRNKAYSVNEIIGRHLPISIHLGCIAMLIAIVMGISCGCFAALHHQSIWDGLAMSFSVLGLSLPSFVIGPLFQWLFTLHWSILPTAGYEGLFEAKYLILPAFTLALPFAARIARLTRGGLLEVLNQDYIRTARSKGLGEHYIIFFHALKGSLLPVVSYLGPAFAGITTGTLVVEKVFQIPGLGREFVESALNRDYTLVMGTVLVYGTFLIVSNLIFDLIAAWMNPRLRGAI
jgi:oligopeptide transport system permease protein